MDIEKYKEAFKRGENIDFYVSRKKLYFFFFLFLGSACLCVCAFLPNFSSKMDGYMKILGILSCFFLLYSVLRIGKGLLFKQHSQFLSLNKEYLVIYDKTIPALLSNKNSCAIIPWGEILDLEIQKIETAEKKHPYIALKCGFPAIQRIQEQLPEKIFKTHYIENNYLFLNTKPWLDIPIEDMLTLLKEFHKEATSQQQ